MGALSFKILLAHSHKINITLAGIILICTWTAIHTSFTLSYVQCSPTHKLLTRFKYYNILSAVGGDLPILCSDCLALLLCSSSGKFHLYAFVSHMSKTIKRQTPATILFWIELEKVFSRCIRLHMPMASLAPLASNWAFLGAWKAGGTALSPAAFSPSKSLTGCKLWRHGKHI